MFILGFNPFEIGKLENSGTNFENVLSTAAYRRRRHTLFSAGFGVRQLFALDRDNPGGIT